jgi:hypothetical protein
MGFSPCVRFEGYGLHRLREVNQSPAGTAELSPGRQSWVGLKTGSSPAGTAENHRQHRITAFQPPLPGLDHLDPVTQD